MPLTAAERAKRYREKLKENPKKFEEQRTKQLERLKRNRKRIKDLTEEEQNYKRKQWREEKKKQKFKRVITDSQVQKDIPASSKSQNKTEDTALRIRYKKIYQRYQSALECIRKLKSRNEAIRKKLYRDKLAFQKKNIAVQEQIDRLMARQEILEISLRETYSTTRSVKEKRVLKSIIQTKVVKKNRKVKSFTTSYLGLKGQIRYKKKIIVNNKIEQEIKEFYERDDISRSTAGKRETKTKGKRKMQIRYLTDTIQNLYQTYKEEGGTCSFTTFFRYKPFYILSPTLRSRDTCMCIKHSNIEYIFIALKSKNLIQYKNIEDAMKMTVCNKTSYMCMYNLCEECNHLSLQFNEDKLENEIAWYTWERVPHTYHKEGKEMTTKKTVKKTKRGKIKDLISQFKTEFSKFKIHYYNWKEQQRQYQLCIKNLSSKEIAILVDFSENYETKLGSEIQSMHFGASKSIISLHCGMIYFKDKSQSFVTISGNTCHEPNAIWAHLFPVLQCVTTSHPSIEIIHFFSDGPTSQYRQKKNFFLINFFTKKFNLKYMTWSFSESGHGKGVADGIGGAVKRQLDRHVAYGHDVKDANDAFKYLEKSMKSVKCILVSDTDIENFKAIIPKDLKTVPNTMKIHQVISVQVGKIVHRGLSCFCGVERGLCSCLNPKTHIFFPTSADATWTTGYNGNKIDQCDLGDQTLNFIDLTNVLPSQKVDQIHSEIEVNFNIGDVLDIENFNIIDSQSIFDLVVNTVDLPEDDYFNLRDKENEDNKRDQLTSHMGSFKRKFPDKDEQYGSKSLKTIINRNFTCNLCRLRKLYVLKDMTKCIVCKNWVCEACCCSQPGIDYICDKCFE